MKPPCKKDGVLCPRRCEGCRETCLEWAKYSEVKEIEYRERRKERVPDLYRASNYAKQKSRGGGRRAPKEILEQTLKQRERSERYYAKNAKIIKSGSGSDSG